MLITLMRWSFQPIIPCMMSTRRALTEAISAAHSIRAGSSLRPRSSTTCCISSPSRPIRWPSCQPVPGMSPLKATIILPPSTSSNSAALTGPACVPAIRAAMAAAPNTLPMTLFA
jgi:hypothetical protein